MTFKLHGLKRKPRLKHEATPEEWAGHLSRSRARGEKYRNKPDSKEKMRRCQAKYRSRPEIKERNRQKHREWVAANGERARARWMKRNGGMTPELIRELLIVQNNACAVCSRPFSEERRPKADHCHDKNEPRGVLCFDCNIAEGVIRKTGVSADEFGRRLAAYLNAPPAQRVR